MADETTNSIVELRTERGELQGKLVNGHYLEVVRHGIMTVYDIRTGRRVRTMEVTRERRQG